MVLRLPFFKESDLVMELIQWTSSKFLVSLEPVNKKNFFQDGQNDLTNCFTSKSTCIQEQTLQRLKWDV